MSAFWAGFVFAWVFVFAALGMMVLGAWWIGDRALARAEFIGGMVAGGCALGLTLIVAVRHFVKDQP